MLAGDFVQSGAGAYTGVRDIPTSRLTSGSGGAPVDLLFDRGFEMQHNRYVMRMFGFPAYHISDGITTVTAEVAQISPTAHPVIGLPAKSRTQILVGFDLHQVFDLTREAARAALGVTEDELTEAPRFDDLDAFDRPRAYELTQCIGELAYRSGAGGIRYPAARFTEGINLVVFTERLQALGGSLTIVHPITNQVQRKP